MNLIMDGLSYEATTHNMQVGKHPLLIAIAGWADCHLSMRTITEDLPDKAAAKWQETGYCLMSLLTHDHSGISRDHTARFILDRMQEVLYDKR